MVKKGDIVDIMLPPCPRIEDTSRTEYILEDIEVHAVGSEVNKDNKKINT